MAPVRTAGGDIRALKPVPRHQFRPEHAASGIIRSVVRASQRFSRDRAFLAHLALSEVFLRGPIKHGNLQPPLRKCAAEAAAYLWCLNSYGRSGTVSHEEYPKWV